MFVGDGGECLVAQSYAKNMGLYGERVGALSIVRLLLLLNVCLAGRWGGAVLTLMVQYRKDE